MSKFYQTAKKKRSDAALHGGSVFRNERGAIDLASIMVGIIVIGLVGGVIAATVFAVIPWTQDNAAKHQLESISSAQSAYKGLSSSNSLPSFLPHNSYADSYELKEAKLLSKGSNYCTVKTEEGVGYKAYAQSSSGKTWMISETTTKPQLLVTENLPAHCGHIVPYDDKTPTVTTLTYKCDTTKKGVIPMNGALTGTETWASVGTPVTTSYSNNETATPRTLNAGVEYKVAFNGTYASMDSRVVPTGSVSIADCLRSVDHWGKDTKVTSAAGAFFGASKLTSVPAHIPTTITNFTALFQDASIFNDPNINQWDTSNVTSMTLVFIRAVSFNQPLDNWDTSKVTSFSSMFQEAPSFNQPLNDWDVSKAVTLNQMFNGATSFNQPLDRWDTSNVSIMSSTFAAASAFNQPLNTWKVSKVTKMTYMFAGSFLFNQDLSGWNTSSLETYEGFASSAFPQAFLPPKVAN